MTPDLPRAQACDQRGLVTYKGDQKKSLIRTNLKDLFGECPICGQPISFLMPRLDRAQAVVEGCRHTTSYLPKGACAPCIQTYAEEVRREERERIVALLDKAQDGAAPGFRVAAFERIIDTLRPEAGDAK